MTITGDTGSYVSANPTVWELSERIRKGPFTWLLDYRADLKNPNISYADGRDKWSELYRVDEEINMRMKR